MPGRSGGCPGSQPWCVQPYLGRKRGPAEGGIRAELIVWERDSPAWLLM